PLLPHFWTYLFLIIMAIFVLFPLVFSFSQSLMTNQEVNRWPPPIIPRSPTFDNYNTVFTQPDLKLAIWLRNSLFAASAYTLVVMVICAPAAYAFARLRFPGNNLLFGLLLLTLMIPSHVTLNPNFLLMVICAPAAYAFARLRFPGNNLLFGRLPLPVMIPSLLTLIPNCLLIRELRFFDTFHALFWPGAADVFSVVLRRQFFPQIPH